MVTNIYLQMLKGEDEKHVVTKWYKHLNPKMNGIFQFALLFTLKREREL